MAHTTRLQICGLLAAEFAGRRIEGELPGRQGRLLLVYLVVHRLRPIRRDELVEALWPGEPPAATDAALRALLSKLRRVLPDGALEGRGELRLVLRQDAHVDLEVARVAIHRAESALAAQDWGRAWGASQSALFTSRRGFLVDESADWIDEVRRELDDLYVRALEAYSQASLGIGGIELAAAERGGRDLIRVAPYRESGYRHLMRALDRTGNGAEAVLVYERLRALLRDELGLLPSAETVELHAALLSSDRLASQGPAQ